MRAGDQQPVEDNVEPIEERQFGFRSDQLQHIDADIDIMQADGALLTWSEQHRMRSILAT